MRIFLLLFFVLLGVVSAEEFGNDLRGFLFKVHDPKVGERVIHRAVSDASGGKMRVVNGGVLQEGRSDLKRTRWYEKTAKGKGAMKQREYRVFQDVKERAVELGEKKDANKIEGALTGQVISAMRDDLGRWRLFLEGKVANQREVDELLELEAYENKRMYQDMPVKVGDSWFVDPGFIRHFIERDMGSATVDAKMTFSAIEEMDGERTAVLDFVIQSEARKVGAAERVASVVVDLKGVMYVSLETMLDKRMMMTGTVVTTVRQQGSSSVVQTPVTYLMEKSIERVPGE